MEVRKSGQPGQSVAASAAVEQAWLRPRKRTFVTSVAIADISAPATYPSEPKRELLLALNFDILRDLTESEAKPLCPFRLEFRPGG